MPRHDVAVGATPTAMAFLVRSLAVIAALLSAACTTPEKVSVFLTPETSGHTYSQLVVTSVRNDTGQPVPMAILDRTGDRLASQLAQSGFGVSRAAPVGSGQDFLTIDPHMVAYEAGSAAGRWIGFGAGAAICSVRIEATDGLTGKHAGDATVSQSIQGGGLYSIGAGDYIVDRCADALAAGIAAKLGKGK